MGGLKVSCQLTTDHQLFLVWWSILMIEKNWVWISSSSLWLGIQNKWLTVTGQQFLEKSKRSMDLCCQNLPIKASLSRHGDKSHNNESWMGHSPSAHPRGPLVHERDPLMWGIALFRFINCVIGNEDKFKCIDWVCQSWKHNDLQSLWVYQFAFKFKDPLLPKISSGWLQSTNVRLHNLHVRSYFSVIFQSFS